MNKLMAGLISKFAILMLAGLTAANPEPVSAFRVFPQEAVPVAATGVFAGEEESGPVSSLPWEFDEAFLKRRQESGAAILMGAYCAVLRDPLPGEEFNVHLAASMLAGIVMKPGQTFSQNQAIGPYTTGRGFRIGPTYFGTSLSTTIGGGVCKIASTLYNVTVLSDLKAVERHCHSMPVPYVPYGQDATVAYGAKDFKFRNDTPFPVMIWAQGIENRLYIAFYGQVNPPDVKWSHEFKKIIKARTVYKHSSALAPGTQRMVLEGMDGAVVKSCVTVRYADGRQVVKNMGASYYDPMPFIIEKGD